MSYLSATENVGFSGIPQTISDASCATQYKMAVEGVSGNCSEVMYIPESSAEDSTYMTHLNDNFYSKFKIDPNDLYTFHDSDVIAGEITVSHTEDTFIFPENDTKPKIIDCPSKELDILGAFTNGDLKKEIKKKVLSNGHCTPVSKSVQKDKTSNTKAQKAKSQIKEARRDSLSDARKQNGQSPKAHVINVPAPSSKTSINSVNTNSATAQKAATSSMLQAGNETFLDVFKREQGLVENDVVIKTETQSLPPPVKIPSSPPKKSTAKTPSHSKARRGRGPAVHEALQRISAQKRAIPIPNTRWHAPGYNLFDCGPLDNKIPAFRIVESSSSDDDTMPDFESGNGPVCVEETAAESRGARLALRRAALRRHVARAHVSLRLSKDFKEQKTLASIIMKQLNSPGSSGQLPTPSVNHLLAMRGMPAVLNTQERRKLRESGWSGGESGSTELPGSCSIEDCQSAAVPCGRHCLAHVTRAPEQRLYAACAAVFAGGARCRAPLLPLHTHTPLCAEHAWKRDNYDKLLKDNKPKKAARRNIVPAPRRAKRRRRPPPRPRPPAPPRPVERSLSEINVCSNSSTYDSSEETAMGALSENEYITVASHELEVEHVPADDILDPAVLSQIPDEAFTEFFNQGIVLAEGETSFGEGSELAAALEAVLDNRLDERALDDRELDDRLDEQTIIEEELEESGLETMDDSVFQHSPDDTVVKGEMQIPTSITMEISSSATS